MDVTTHGSPRIPGYRIIEVLSSSTTSMVVRGLSVDGVTKIVKTTSDTVDSPSKDTSDRYLREFEILRYLADSGYVVNAHELVTTTGRPLLVLEDSGGVKLDTLLAGGIDLDRFFAISISLAHALADLHRRRVIHKDLKPSNILIDPKSLRVQLVDFGCATRMTMEYVADGESTIDGTLSYMSPEQTGRMNHPLDYRTDLYSLGITMFRMATGRLPFTADDPLSWFHCHLAQKPPRPDDLNPELPRIVADIILKLLAKQPADRYQSAEGLARDLTRCRETMREDKTIPVFVLGERDFAPGLQIPGLLYGREAELAALIRAYREVVDTGGRALTLVAGYSGIGKSSLVSELHRPIVDSRGVFLAGNFDQLRRDIPYATLATALRPMIQTILGADEAAIRKWREQILDVLAESAAVIVDLIPELVHIIGEQPPVPELGPGETKIRFINTLRGFIKVLAKGASPLVLFFDDMQWADLGTIELFTELMFDPTIENLLLILAYRDNEVDAAHPLTLAIDQLRRGGVKSTKITLAPLDLAALGELVATTMHRKAADANIAALTRVIADKTGANPFFVIEFLRRLYADGLLTQDPETGVFHCDPEAVMGRNYTDNVLEHMAKRLEQLDKPSTDLVCLAACIGGTFTLRDICLVSDGSSEQVSKRLWPVLDDGVLVHVRSSKPGSSAYRFQHDRIQQAAYAFLDEDTRMQLHARIGRAWLRDSDEDQLRERLFEITDQLNRATALLDHDEAIVLARLDLRAAERASNSGAIESAIRLADQGLALLGADGPTQHYELASALMLILIESNLAKRAYDRVDELCVASRGWLRGLDKARIYAFQTENYVGLGQIESACKVNLEGVAEFGLELPLAPDAAQVGGVFAEVEALRANYDDEALLELPEMTSPEHCARMVILDKLASPAFMYNNNLFALHVLEMVRYTLVHGVHPASPTAFTWYGLLLGGMQNRWPDGHALATAGLRIAEKYRYVRALPRVLNTVHMTAFWVRPIHEAIELVERGFHTARELGDIAIACYCSNKMITQLRHAGKHLEELYERARQMEHFNRQIKIADGADLIVSMIRLFQLLRGQTYSPDSFDDDDFSLAEFEASIADRMPLLGLFNHLMVAIGRFLTDDIPGALNRIEQAKGVLTASVGTPQVLDLHFYRALILARHTENAVDEAVLAEIEGHHQAMADWAGMCPSTFEGKALLVEAELARLRKLAGARELYLRAIAASEAAGFVHDAAVAYEALARYLEREADKPGAVAAWFETYRLYGAWGASAKCLLLESAHPFLQETSSTTGSDHHALDAHTMIKATTAISEQIEREGLVRELLRLAKESAGCAFARLVIMEDGHRLVFDENAQLVSTDGLPLGVLNLVQRTGERQIHARVAAKPTLVRELGPRSADVRSLLCLPIRRQGIVVGELYLESHLVEGTFSDDRVAVLEALAAQAAISLENARLYAELEQRIAERTSELHETQRQLVESARKAGMAEIASGILHNIGNTLNSMTVSTSLMVDRLHASRLADLRRVTDLLISRGPELGAYLTHDPQGRQVPALIVALVEHLEKQEQLTFAEIENLRQHVNHIGAIVRTQQQYATHVVITYEHLRLSEVIAEALQMTAAHLASRAIEVVRELGDDHPIDLDRHVVIQILVNLLTNATDAMSTLEPGTGRLTITSWQDDEYSSISLRDNGEGIAEDQRDAIFAFGFTTREGGHGFGLHSAALSAQVMGGKLTVESPGPGGGATFTLTLPNRRVQ